MRNITVIMICIQLVCAFTARSQNPDGQKVGQKITTFSEDEIGQGETFFKNFELDAIVPVETTDDYLVSYIGRTVRSRNKLIFKPFEQHYIFVVDIETGKVEAFINRRGHGPGEYSEILDIALDDNLEQILVLSNYKKLMFFDMNGKFIKEEYLDFEGRNITYVDGKVLIYDRWGGIRYPYEFHIYDLAQKTVQKIGESTQVSCQFCNIINMLYLCA